MEKSSFPKVLVISHNVFSKTSNMGKTMTQFFGEWEKESLAQLYFHSEIPNVDLCDRYCRITDFDILKSFAKTKANATYLTKADADLEIKNTRIDKGIKSYIYRFGRNKTPFLYLLRNALWNQKKWKSNELMNWIDEFNPELIFYPAGDYCFSMNIVINICKEKKIPLVTFFGDDYYFLDVNRKSIFDKINKKMYRRTFNQLMSYTSFYITASDKMFEVYKKEFGGNGCVLLTPSPKTSNPVNKLQSKISYIGNLGLNRYKALIEIGRVLKKTGFLLDVYSAETDKNILNNLTIDNGIRFHGVASAKDVQNIMASSILLIHAESMDEVNKEKTKYSMSTKISEYLNSGICIFAYGPDDIASIEYLKHNDIACVVTTQEDLEKYILKALNDEGFRKKYIENASKLAEKRHSYKANTTKFYEIIEAAVKNYKVGHVYENSSS